MGEIKKPQNVKLICGILFSKDFFKQKYNLSLSQIQEKINGIVLLEIKKTIPNLSIDLQSETLSFNQTTYYREELGENICRYWISFSPLVELENLHKIKLLTNDIEKNFFSEGGKRKVNLDPGYVEGSKLVLFTTKNYSHRIYISNGIYSEVTLTYRNNNFITLSWTYPDYQTQTALIFFSKVRNLWVEQK